METATKPKPKQSRAEPMAKKQKPVEIDPQILKEFVGKVDNLWRLEAKHLWDNRFRINVWTEIYKEGHYCAFHQIEQSYFVHYINDKIVDKTIEPKPKKERLF